MPTNTETFRQWLTEELVARNWKQADLAREAGISTTAVSAIFSGRHNAGTAVAIKIANALECPPETVFRAAGILPPGKEIDEVVHRIIHDMEGLSLEDRELVSAYIRMLKNFRKRGSSL